MATVTYLGDRGANYAAQKGVKIKVERDNYAPGHPEMLFAMGPNDTEWFICQVDDFGNICDADGIVVYPSKSGAHPLDTGERGYFGGFVENYTKDGAAPEYANLPRVKHATSVKSARQALGLTQKQLADAAGVNIRLVQKVEGEEAEPRNLTAKNLLAIAKVLCVSPYDLI